MQSVSSDRNTGESQVDLVDLWKILARRRYWILAVVLVALALAGAYVFLKAPVFESRAKIDVGQVPSNRQPMDLEPAEVLVTRLREQYGPLAPDGSPRPHPYLAQAAVQKGTSTVIELVARGDVRGEPANLLQTIYSDVSNAHRETYERNLGVITERLRQLDNQLGALRLHAQEITDLLVALKVRDPVQASLLMIERGRVLTSLGELEAQRPDLVQQLAEPQSRPTRLLNEIAASAEPSEPRPAAAFVLAFVLGLVGGVLLAFFLEFLAYATSTTTR